MDTVADIGLAVVLALFITAGVLGALVLVLGAIWASWSRRRDERRTRLDGPEVHMSSYNPQRSRKARS